MYYKTDYKTPIGNITLACNDAEALVGLWIEGQKYFQNTINGDIIEKDELLIFKKAKKWLDRYFAGDRPRISELSLAPAGSDFRQRIWQILCKIPYGSVYTYGEIADIIAKEDGKARMSAQAVGGAIGRNPISIIIPCHRVIGSNGNLTGYAGGIETKIQLLEFEGVNLKELHNINKRKQKSPA